MALQGVETVAPGGAVRGEPLIDLSQRFGPEPVHPALRIDSRLHQAGLAQHTQMFGHPGLAETELGHEIADRPLVFSQEVQDPASMGLGQHVEHRVNITVRQYSCQAMDVGQSCRRSSVRCAPMAGHPDVETVERLIPAAPEVIFALLADANRHPDIDGSGSVRGVKGETRRLSLHSTFGMSMRIGIPYSMVNTVIEYEEGRRLAWQTRGPTAIGRFVGGRIWRYELEPRDGGTLVRESWDISQESPFTKPVVRRGGAATRKNMAATLARIEELVTG